MTTMIRHGGGSHYVRPDAVYRTSVLAPMAGYSPGADVQSVAMAFTSPFGPNGLNGLGNSGGIAAWWAGVKAKWAAKRALVASRFGFAGLGSGPPGPAYQTAQQIAPQIATQMQMLAHLAPSRGGGPFASAISAGTRRWNTYYIAG